MADVFISYSKQEAELTIDLAHELERRGYTTWWDTTLLPGEEFLERITAELYKARAVIVIWTQSSVASKWVQAEAQLAASQNKLITVRSQDLHPDRIPLPFNTRHADLITDREKIFAALLRYDLLPPLEQDEGASADGKAIDNQSRRGVTGQKLTARSKFGDSLIRSALLLSPQSPPGFWTKLTKLNRMQIAFMMIILAFGASTAEIVSLSRTLNQTLVSLLQIDPNGVLLNGSYLFPHYLLNFVIITLSVSGALLCILFAAYLARSKSEPQDDRRILKQDMDDVIRYADNITSYIYPGDTHVPRFDIIGVQVRHQIKKNGDTNVDAVFEIMSASEPAHFWKYWINADPESPGVSSLRQLNFEVIDVDSMRKLDWLPTLSDTRHKVFAIFFPEVRPGTRKRLRISFFWPCYMKKLIDLGATNFDWSYRSQHPEKRARFRKEWIFENQDNAIRCRLTGRQSATALLHLMKFERRDAWVYEDSSAVMDSTKYSVEFSIDAPELLTTTATSSARLRPK
jgi:hypothetical protein